MTTRILHKRNTSSFNTNVPVAICGATGPDVALTMNTKYVNCPKCKARTWELRTAAKERVAHLLKKET